MRAERSADGGTTANHSARAEVRPMCRQLVADWLDPRSERAYSETLMLAVNILRKLGVVVVVFCAVACGGSLGPRADAGRDVVARGTGGSGGRSTGEDAGRDRASGAGGASGGAGGNWDAAAVRACKTTTTATTGSKSCRVPDECGPIGPYKCCTGEPCWPASACPFPPSMCPNMSSRFACTTSSDCDGGGTCASITMGCPQCEYRSCTSPPPPPAACTLAPDSCGTGARCQTDGTCAPLSCADGYACAAGSRCHPGGARSDTHQCEFLPCDDGWTCDENTRCTAPADPSSHGCTTVGCTKDDDCDCGYCVNGSCASNLGFCSYPPQ